MISDLSRLTSNHCPTIRDKTTEYIEFVPTVPAVPLGGTRDNGTQNREKVMNTQIIEILSLLFNYQEMLMEWSATPIQIYSQESLGFSVTTSNYKGSIVVTFSEGSFFMIEFVENNLHILGVTDAEKAIDLIKDYVEKREVWV